MAFYRNVIPEDYSEELRKRILDRDSDSESLPCKRSRTSTDTLLSDSSNETSTSNLESPTTSTSNLESPEPPIQSPKPEENLENYNRKRLQQGLRYIKTTETRKITPRTREFLRFQKDAYKIALESAKPTVEALAVVQALDQIYHSAAFDLKPKDPDQHHYQMCLVKLRRLELLANYGDYLGQELQEIRVRLKAATSSGDPDVIHAARSLGPAHTWVQISDELKGVDIHNLRKDVWVTSTTLGLDPNHMTWLINEWAERNRLFHNQIRHYIIDCDWARLAEQLFRDSTELLVVSVDPEERTSYEKVLLRLRDEYFNAYDPDDHRSWFPNATAFQLTHERMAQKKKMGGKK